jgi:hypothetical protein
MPALSQPRTFFSTRVAQCRIARNFSHSIAVTFNCLPPIEIGRLVLGMHHPAASAMRRCPVQPSTPLGPDQVNVLLLLLDGLT